MLYNCRSSIIPLRLEGDAHPTLATISIPLANSWLEIIDDCTCNLNSHNENGGVWLNKASTATPQQQQQQQHSFQSLFHSSRIPPPHIDAYIAWFQRHKTPSLDFIEEGLHNDQGKSGYSSLEGIMKRKFLIKNIGTTCHLFRRRCGLKPLAI